MAKNQNASDLQGVGQLAIDAIKGITGIVETLHATILKGGLGEVPEERPSKGISGLVYRMIYATTELTGRGLEMFFRAVAPLLEDIPYNSNREAVVAAINGVLGDYLVSRGNPMAIETRFRSGGESISTAQIKGMLEAKKGSSKDKNALLVLVHGLCMNDLQWTQNGHNHGELLAEEFGYTPIYLNYNTGKHISENGKEFSNCLEALSEELSEDTEIYLLVHSMGGLVSRSAYQQAVDSGAAWPRHLKKLICLGTPHQGAMLEKGGNWIDVILDANPYTKPFSKLGKIRSAGITDMRYSSITESDWKGKDRFASEQPKPTVVPLPNDAVDCYAIATSTAPSAHKLHDESIGDGLVTLSSGLGKHKNPEQQIHFPKENTWVGYGVDHLRQLSAPTIYEVLREWLR